MAIHVSIDYVKGTFMKGFSIAKPAMDLLSERLSEARAFEGDASTKAKPAKETSIPALIDRHGRFETAVICAAVEHLAGAVLVRDHGVRGAISRTLPLISTRAQDTFEGACDFFIDKAHTLVDAAVKVLDDNLEAAASSSGVVHTGVQAADAAIQKVLGEHYVEDAKTYLKDLPIRAVEYSVVKAVQVYVPCKVKVERMRMRSRVASVVFDGAVRSSFFGVVGVSAFFAFTHVYAISLDEDEDEDEAPHRRWRRSIALFGPSASCTTVDTNSGVDGDEADMEDNIDMISFSSSTASGSDSYTANVSGSDACVLLEKSQDGVDREAAFSDRGEVDSQKDGVEQGTNMDEDVEVSMFVDGAGLEVVEPVVLVMEMVKPSYVPCPGDVDGEAEADGECEGEDDGECVRQDNGEDDAECEWEDNGEIDGDGDGDGVEKDGEGEGEFLIRDMVDGTAKDQECVEAMDIIWVEGNKDAADISTDIDGEVVIQDEMPMCEVTRRDGSIGFGLFPCVSVWRATSTVDIVSRTQAICQPEPTHVNHHGGDGTPFPVDAQSHVYPPSISSLVSPFDLFVSSTPDNDNASSSITETHAIDTISAGTSTNITTIAAATIITNTDTNSPQNTSNIADNDNNSTDIANKNITITIDDRTHNEALEVTTTITGKYSNKQEVSYIQGSPEAVDTQVYPEIEADEEREKMVRGAHPVYQAVEEVKTAPFDQSQIEIDAVHAALVGDVSCDSYAGYTVEAEDHFVVPSFTVSMPCLAAVAESASIKEALVFNTSVSFDCRLISSKETVESEGVCAEEARVTTGVAPGVVVPPHSSLTATAAPFVPRAQPPSTAGSAVSAAVPKPAHWTPAPRVEVTLEKAPVPKSRTASATGRRARHRARTGKVAR